MFIVPNHLKSRTNDVSPGHWRIQAVKISLSASSSILLINSYFPTDPRTNDFDEDELRETLHEITSVIDKNSCNKFLLLGDINCDFRRNTRFVHSISSFLQEYNLMKSWGKFEVDFTHFQENNGNTHVSILDHFFWNEIIGNNVKEAGVIHHCENLSDHSPIYCLLDVEIDPTTEVKTETPPPNLKPSWRLATKEQKDSFPTILNDKLSTFSIPYSIKNCTDVKCRDVDHCEKADDFISKILECIEEAASETLPTPKPKQASTLPSRSKTMPGWKTFVKPF